MKELKLRGYVTPNDCGGDLQKSVELAAALGLNKVVVDRDCKADFPVVLPSGMYLVVENGVLCADLMTAREENYSLRTRYITIEGINGTIQGDIHLFNTHHVNVSGLKLQGTLTFAYCLWGRVEGISGGCVQVGRGCGNFILQNLESDQPARISGDICCGKYVPGSKPDVNNIILCDSRFAKDGVYLDAAEDCGLLNVQVDHVTAAGAPVTVGSGKELPEYAFMNLTFTDLSAPVVYNNAVRHVYEKG